MIPTDFLPFKKCIKERRKNIKLTGSIPITHCELWICRAHSVYIWTQQTPPPLIDKTNTGGFFFLFGAFIISWCNTATSFECSWIWIRMHACVMQHRQSVPFYAAIKEKKTCVSRTFCEMWGFYGVFPFSVWVHGDMNFELLSGTHYPWGQPCTQRVWVGVFPR